MMLFLTGADSSLKKSSVAPQADPAKSLGGFISSSPVPNASLNALFDLISTGTLADRNKETIALGLINQLDKAVTNVRLFIVVDQHPICEWKVAATTVTNDLRMESIPNRYSEPIGAEFYDATFQRASVEFEVKGEPQKDDQFLILPLNITIDVSKEGGLKGFWIGLKNACKTSINFDCERLSDRRFRLCYRDETEVPTPIECHCVKDSNADIEFLTEFANGATGSVLIINHQQEIPSGGAIGLWFQRQVSADYEPPTDEQLIEMKKHNEILPKIEKAEIVIMYEEVQN